MSGFRMALVTDGMLIVFKKTRRYARTHARYLGLLTVLLVCLPGCGLERQWRGPGCSGQTVARSGRQNGSVRGSVIILDDGHAYENLGLKHEWAKHLPWPIDAHQFVK
jgi:hypothetical protein